MYPSAQPVTFALGKFAGQAEFVRMEGGEAFAGLDAWVNEAMMVAHTRGDAFRVGFPMGAAFGFLWRPPKGDREGDELLCGVIAPSRDAVGRDYPLVVATRFSETLVSGVGYVIPHAFGDFLEASYGAIAEARFEPIPAEVFFARIRGIGQPSEYEVTSALDEYATFCAGTTVGTAWGQVFPNSLEPADRALTALAAMLRARDKRDKSPLTLRLPLGVGGTVAAVLWLDVIRRMSAQTDPPSAFWSADAASLLVALGAMPSAALAEIWCPSPASSEIVDVASQEAQPATRLADVGGSSIQAWLESLGP